MGKRNTSACVVFDDNSDHSSVTEPVACEKMGNQRVIDDGDEEHCSMFEFPDKINNIIYAPEPCKIKDNAELVGESAAKKKKKKKVKEKEKKAAGVLSKPGKKVSINVRELQERLAKKKEDEEKKKREEEEKLRMEEEARLKQQELETIARLKKEREKEKKLKKKQQGKVLTPNQKEKAQKLEVRRKQHLEKCGAMIQTTGEKPVKRPVYITNKSKPRQQHTQSTSNPEVDNACNVADMENVEEEYENEEDDDEWDAKSNWDDEGDLKLSGVTVFADEDERVSVPAPVVIKENHPPATNKDKQQEAGSSKEGEKTLRAPICCVLGHVDAGKTKLIDCITRNNIQEGDGLGITQQIDATYIPIDNIRERTKELKADAKLNVPGLLVIDTPGHESFNNLRSRSCGVCDIAIFVVDITHRLQQQTIESMKLLRMRNVEFIVALNKVDKLYGWKTCHNAPFGKVMKQQSRDVQLEFNHRVTQIITEFKEQGLNTELYYKNKDRGETYSIVPTSAISGEGIPEMLLLLIQWAQKTMVEQLTYRSKVQCTVLDVKVTEGQGTTIDVVLVNGVLHKGDAIVVCGFQLPIHTTIRSLSTPQPMRVNGPNICHNEIKAAQVIRITAHNLKHALVGSTLYVVGPDDDVEEIKKLVMDDKSFERGNVLGPDDDMEEAMMRNIMSRIDKNGEGVYVQASTHGSLEALLANIKTLAANIPVGGIGIGPVHKKAVMKASVMLRKKKEFATILAFNVKVTPEARELADDLGVKILLSDSDNMNKLLAQFKAYIDSFKEVKKKEAAEDVVFPCVVKIMPNCVYNKKDPIILGVDVKYGILKIGTPICIPQKDFIDIGRVSSIMNNNKPLDYAKKGQEVSIKITGSNAEEQQKMFGRHFDMDDELVSHITRNSIDVLKANYRDELSREEWRLVTQLKHLLKIQ